MPSCSHNIKPRCLIRSSNSRKYTIPTYHLRTGMQDTLHIAFLATRCNVHSIGIASQHSITMTLHCIRFPCNAHHSIAVNELSCPQMPLHSTTCKAFHCICTFHCPWQHYRTWHDKGSHYSAFTVHDIPLHCQWNPYGIRCANYSITASLCITSPTRHHMASPLTAQYCTMLQGRRVVNAPSYRPAATNFVALYH